MQEMLSDINKTTQSIRQQLVVYRSESGKANALDSFCPDMGMNLAVNKVVGGNLKCIFHEWKFDGTGKCVDLKKKVEHGKSVQGYPVEEKYGLVWFYSDREAPGPVHHLDPFRRIDKEKTMNIDSAEA